MLGNRSTYLDKHLSPFEPAKRRNLPGCNVKKRYCEKHVKVIRRNKIEKTQFLMVKTLVPE